jgi:arylsulfatase A-like enzyme
MTSTQRTYPGHGAIVGRTLSESTPWWPTRPSAPAGAPNVVIVLMDDMGFSDIGPFGSEIDTPNLDRLAARGVRFTNYHTSPVCSPSRAALLTGLNPHRAGFGFVANADPGFPGFTFEIARDVPTLAEQLRAGGYATFAIGKWHLTKDSSMSDASDRSSWPTQRGFDRYYGILEGLTNLHHPHRLIRDNSPVAIDEYPKDFYLTDNLTDEAIALILAHRAESQKPFFMYFAHLAVHGPLHAKQADIAKYAGRYADGWDALRDRRFAKQIADGFFPAETKLPPRNNEPFGVVPAWDDLEPQDQALFARYQEVYAAVVDNVDQNLGRLLGTLDALGELDNTIVIFTSDNGGTGEGGLRGTRSYFAQLAHMPGLPRDWRRDIDRDPNLIGSPRAMTHYPRGWGMASNTPFRMYKAHTLAGGVRVPFVLSWPSGLPDEAGGLHRGFRYVTDLLPTVLDLTGVAHDAAAIDGVSFADALRASDAHDARSEQYIEMVGNRAYFRDKWKLVMGRTGDAAGDEWQLYDVHTDPTETKNVAADHPDIVAALADSWEQAAWENYVFPLDDGTGYMRDARPPTDVARPMKLLPGTPHIERYVASRLISLRSFDVIIDVTYSPGNEGVLVAHGDQGGGYSVYIEDGHLRFAYNDYGNLHDIDAGALQPGSHVVTLRATAVDNFAWDFAVLVNGVSAAQLDHMNMLLWIAPLQGIDIGLDRRSPVSWPVYERHGSFPYTGSLASVTYIPGEPAPYDPQLVYLAAQRAMHAYD